MTKLSILALVSALTLTGAAAPALAAMPASATSAGNVPLCSSEPGHALDAQKDSLASQLHLSTTQGSSIDVWNGCFKVMTTVNGKTQIAFYDPDSLKLISTLS